VVQLRGVDAVEPDSLVVEISAARRREGHGSSLEYAGGLMRHFWILAAVLLLAPAGFIYSQRILRMLPRWAAR
jgi:hypothetical protein